MDRGRCLADRDHGAQVGGDGAKRSEILALRAAAGDQHGIVDRRDRRERRMDVRRLRVVEEPDAVDLGDGLAAVGRGLERGEPVTDRLRRDAVGERGRRGGRGIGAMPGALAVDRAELDRTGGSDG